ncbi:MAG: GDYXXLXY domain-containing protein [Verrucomicrobia bacterium]|nr:GDYXXLXY domain-containing protein [Verrucomicrobiota bacterium]
MRKIIAVAAGLLMLLAVNWSILGREALLKNGQVVLLDLAPVDPRSLMQGDYMALRFKVADQLFGRGVTPKETEDGRIIVKLDEHGVGNFVRRDDGKPLGAGEVALRYRIRNSQVKFATNGFFFQEGHASDYQHARYGEFRVAPSGDLLLTHLRGEKLERLGKPEH